MSVAADVPARKSRLADLVRTLRTWLIGTVLCLTPITAILVLGWLMRRMRFVALRRAGLESLQPGWVFGPDGGVLSRLVGGLAANARAGLNGALSLALATLPFAALWSFSWWAGWENSFSKGYEQSWVGPTLGLTGVLVFCLTMVWLPMAIAHQAVEGRALALFEWRRVKSAVRATGWGYVALAVATVFFALPLFASRGLVVFASDIIPGFDSMTPEDVAELAGRIALIKAAYVFAALVILRGWLARIYATSVARVLNGSDAALWQTSPLAKGSVRGQRGWQLTHWLRLVLLMLIWFGLVVQIFVAQFLNHDWTLWLTHPFVFLPWLP